MHEVRSEPLARHAFAVLHDRWRPSTRLDGDRHARDRAPLRLAVRMVTRPSGRAPPSQLVSMALTRPSQSRVRFLPDAAAWITLRRQRERDLKRPRATTHYPTRWPGDAAAAASDRSLPPRLFVAPCRRWDSATIPVPSRRRRVALVVSQSGATSRYPAVRPRISARSLMLTAQGEYLGASTLAGNRGRRPRARGVCVRPPREGVPVRLSCSPENAL